jgi:hypothetical protein
MAGLRGLCALPPFPRDLVKASHNASVSYYDGLRAFHQKEIDWRQADLNHRRKSTNYEINYDEVFVIYRLCRWPDRF